MPHFDGGSRLAAYELLVRLSPTDGRPRAWKALHADIAAGEVGPIDVFHCWDRIVTMLAPQTNAVDIWKIVSEHVEALTAHAHQGERAVLPPAEDPTDGDAAAAIVCSIAARYLDHNAIALAQGAQEFFADRLLVADRAAEAELSTRLTAPSVQNDGALLVLAAFARIRSAVPPSMHSALRTLRRSPSYSTRRAALALAVPENGTDVAVPAIHRPLPAALRIVHPRVTPRRRPPLPSRGAMLPPAEDAADLIAVFRGELDLIAEWADVQPAALYQYIADRAIAYLPKENRTLAFDDESALREEMRRLGRKVTYRRPRPRRVERALAEVTAMLVDYGALGARFFPALDRVFRNADPYFLQVRPGVRPHVIRPIPERAESKYIQEKWTEGVKTDDAITGRVMQVGVNAGQRAPAGTHQPGANPGAPEARVGEKLGDEWIILAEETWLRWLDWALPTETRVGVRFGCDSSEVADENKEDPEVGDPAENDGDTAAGESLSRHVASFSHLTVDEYQMRARNRSAIVVRNQTYRFPKPRSSWLALNPALAEHLGWHLADDGLFRWLDRNGHVVAESVWWQDGFSQQHPPRFQDEVGYGWIVRARVDGWRHIATAVGASVDYRRVARLARDQTPTTAIEHKPVP